MKRVLYNDLKNSVIIFNRYVLYHDDYKYVLTVWVEL